MDTPTGAETVHWDLTDLYPSAEAVHDDLNQAAEEAESFANAYRGTLESIDTASLRAALEAYEALQDRLGRAFTYAYLNWSTATHEAERGALLQTVRERYTAISQLLIFFELEWTALDDERAQALMEAPELESYRHVLEVKRLEKPYLLSEPEEKILADKSVTGRSAWVRFFDETVGAMRFTMEGEEYTQQQILSKLYDADRSIREAAALAFTGGLQREARTLTFIFNTVLADKASSDRLRSYPHWLRSRNLSNEVGDDTVDALIQAVTERYDLVQRFYGLKQRVLGLDTMYDYDRYAPTGDAQTTYSWSEARTVVEEAYSGFHGQMGTIVARFFDEQWIDAALAPGKRGGAFSHGAVPSVHPYILMNYTGKIRDVQTLAHELGHGVHQYLSREQGALQAHTPLTTAETASVFGEMLVFQRLMQREDDPKAQLSMLMGKIDDSMATVFRQVAMNRYEDRIHTARREEGELSTERFSELWIETQTNMFGTSVALGDHYRSWWSYIPHFLHTPGYVYAYAFGELLVLALYARYKDEGPSFSDKYLGLLRAGGSDWPHVLVSKLGIDLQDPAFWHQGLTAIETLIARAEEVYANL